MVQVPYNDLIFKKILTCNEPCPSSSSGDGGELLAEGDSEAIAPRRRVSSASSAICRPILLASTCELMSRDISRPPGLPLAAKYQN